MLSRQSGQSNRGKRSGNTRQLLYCFKEMGGIFFFKNFKNFNNKDHCFFPRDSDLSLATSYVEEEAV